MAYITRVPSEALAISRMKGDYAPFYSFDITKALYGKSEFPTTATDVSNGLAQGNQWLSQFMPVDALWPIKLSVDLGAPYDIERIYYENSHDRGGTTQVGFKDVNIYGTNSIGAYRELRGDILNDLTLLWSGTFERHIETTGGQATTYISGDIADPKYINLTTHGYYRYYVFVVHNIYFNPNTVSQAYTGIRRIELLEAISSSSSSSSSTEINSSSSSSIT